MEDFLLMNRKQRDRSLSLRKLNVWHEMAMITNPPNQQRPIMVGLTLY